MRSCTRHFIAMAAAIACALWMTAPAAATDRIVTNCGDTTPGGGAPGQLRRLINDAVAGDVIIIPACIITLTGTALDDANSTGDLDIKKSLTIQGAGPGQTIIDGGGVDRVFQISGLGVVVAISGLTIRNGDAKAQAGGGIHSSATLTLTNVAVSGNRATPFGGGISSGYELNLFNVTVSDNVVTDPFSNGGGILSSPGGGVTMTMVNVTISNNRAAISGGGVHVGSGTATLNHVTIASNQVTNAGGQGGGLYVSAVTTTVVRNTIIADNGFVVSGTGPDCYTSATLDSRGSNLVQNPSDCGGLVAGDLTSVSANLGPLAANNGPTPTHALLPGSPAIDAGDAVCAFTDQRGVLRPQISTAGGPARCEIGAFEVVFVAAPPPPPPPNPLSIFPASGTLWATQGFDLILVVEAAGRTVVSGQITFDGVDVTGPVVGCIIPGTVLSGGQTFRCPGLRGSLLGPGSHTLSVTLNLSDGSALSNAVTWNVRADQEP